MRGFIIWKRWKLVKSPTAENNHNKPMKMSSFRFLSTLFVMNYNCENNDNIFQFPLHKPSFCQECFLPVIKETKTKNAHLICAGNSPCPADILLHHVPGVTWTFGNKYNNIVVGAEWKDVCVISADDVPSWVGLLEQFVNCQRSKVVFVHPANTVINLKHIQNLFTASWRLGVVDVVAVITERLNGTVLCSVYSYVPFTRNRCYDTTPILLNTWKRNNLPSFSVSYFPENKIKSLHSCAFNLQHEKLREGALSNELILRPYRLVVFLMSAMNAIPKIMLENGPGFPDGLSNDTDMVFGRFFPLPERYTAKVFSPIFSRINLRICLTKFQVKGVQWFRFLNEFSLPVWCGILFTFVASVFVYFNIVKNGVDTIFVCLQSLLAIPVPMKRFKSANRPFLLLWLMFCLIVDSAYQSALKSRLTVPFFKDAIQGVPDLVAANIPVYVSAKLTKTLANHFSFSAVLKPLIPRMQEVNASYFDVISDPKFTSKTAYICNMDDLHFLYSHSLNRSIDVKYTNFVTLFMLQKPSPYERIFKKSVLRIFDAGFFEFVMGHSKRTVHRPADGYRVPLSVEGLSAVFTMWSVGCLLGFISFIFEIICKLRCN